MIKSKKKGLKKNNYNWQLLLLCIPALIGYILFNYVPMAAAITIPFKNYKFALGIWGSDWVGLKNFEWLFTATSMQRVFRNTIGYGVWFLIVGPVTNVIMALLLFEITNKKSLKIYQTAITFPNFMSMVVVGYVTYTILSPSSGLMNRLIEFMGGEPLDVYTKPGAWPVILTIVNIWKGIGMGSLMYYASLMGIDASLFEAAELDGAGRFQKMRYISLPHLIPLVCIFVILGAGSVIGGHFDLFYVIPKNSSAVYATTDVLDTYVYRALQDGSYAMGATVDLFKGVVSMILVASANLIVKKISPENSMF